jgi:acylphosphatase
MDRNRDEDRPVGVVAERWLVAGLVQGVGFRYFVLHEARRLRIRGDVRNLPDGRVEVRAQATPDQLERLRDVVRAGPRGARVDRVSTAEGDPAVEFEDFRVRY